MKRQARRCVARRSDGNSCQKYAINGATVCASHGGATGHIKAKAAIRAEVMSWGLDAPAVDPGETLLKLVSQSAARAHRYSLLLEEAYDAAERLRVAHEAGELLVVPEESRFDDSDEFQEPAATQKAREDLERIFNTGGISALVGNTYATSNTGSLYATGEAIRGLATLEAQERERCASWCTKAIAAGLAERTVRLAERQGALIAELLRSVLADPELGLTEEQKRMVPDVAERHLRVAG